jgi:hypothetical protein
MLELKLQQTLHRFAARPVQPTAPGRTIASYSGYACHAH